jgi:flagellin
MALNLISNYAANVAHRNLVQTDTQATASLAKLSSGQRIVQAKDDAASLAIGSRVAAEVGALKQALINTGQAGSMLQIADGSLANATDILTRMKALAVQASSGQISDTERAMLDTEYQSLKTEITRIGNATSFNGVYMLAGSITVTTPPNFNNNEGIDAASAQGISTGNLAIGITATTGGNVTISATDSNGDVFTGTISSSAFTAGQLTVPTSITLTSTNAQVTGTVTLNLSTAFSNVNTIATTNGTAAGTSTTSVTFKVGTGTNPAADDLTFNIPSLVAIAQTLASSVTTKANADTASGEVTAAIDQVSTARAAIGANQSRLEFAGANVSTSIENLDAARSQLLDLDVAQEMTKFSSKQVLEQAGVAMLAQANQMPQMLMKLFQ